MKRLLFILPLMLLLASCYDQERNCADFKIGKFKSEYTAGGKTYTSTFNRTKSLEIANVNGKIDTTAIRWINDCEYIGTKVNPKNMQDKKAVNIKILTTHGNSYTFEFSIVGDTQKQKGTVTKID